MPTSVEVRIEALKESLRELDRQAAALVRRSPNRYEHLNALRAIVRAALNDPVDKCPVCGINRNSPFPCEHEASK